MDKQTQEKIANFINNNQVALFMKGTAQRPECGFSAKVIEALQMLTYDFATMNVLADPLIREGIKEYSSWPTIPQLYINGEFIGGCDITLELAESKELAKLLGIKKALTKPNITIEDDAVLAFKTALEQNTQKEDIRISIAANFEHSLEFDTANKDDFLIECNDIKLIIDPYSAAKAEGLRISFHKSSADSGFDFYNPNIPSEVKELTVEELHEWQSNKKPLVLIDVRPKSEWDIAHIDFAKRLEDLSIEEQRQLSHDVPIIFHCHHGGRSFNVAQKWRLKGYSNIYNLSGGIDDWAKKVDNTIKTY